MSHIVQDDIRWKIWSRVAGVLDNYRKMQTSCYQFYHLLIFDFLFLIYQIAVFW